MNKTLNLILAVVFAVLLGWYFALNGSADSHLHDLIKKPGMPEYSGEKLTATIFDLNGKPQYFAEAKEIRRFEETERTEFIQARLELFDLESGAKQWQAVANRAEITKEKLLHLYGDVQLTSFDPQSRLQKVTTEQLTINLATHDMSSDAVVSAEAVGLKISGKGLSGNLKQQVATLLQAVKTEIQPNLIQPISN